MRLRALIAGTALLAVSVSLYAQHGAMRASGLGSFGFSARNAASPQRATGIWKSSAGDFRTGRAFRSAYLYGGPSLWWDTQYDNASAQPQIYEIQPAPSAPAANVVTAPASRDPLMIELRGDRYVRVSSATQPGAVEIAASTSVVSAPPASVLAPTVFVFRDGHREESSDYSIYDGVIHTRAQLWTDGSWGKQIPLASLNIPESLKANRERGVQLQLPSAPNEVVVRP